MLWTAETVFGRLSSGMSAPTQPGEALPGAGGVPGRPSQGTSTRCIESEPRQRRPRGPPACPAKTSPAFRPGGPRRVLGSSQKRLGFSLWFQNAFNFKRYWSWAEAPAAQPALATSRRPMVGSLGTARVPEFHTVVLLCTRSKRWAFDVYNKTTCILEAMWQPDC